MGLIQRLAKATSRSDLPWIVRVLRTVGAEGYHALTRQHGIPLVKRIACWRRGFFADKAILYDFEKFGYDPFLTDYERHVRTNRIARHGYVLGDKYVAYYVLKGIGAPTPELLACVGPGEGARVEQLARDHGAVLVKPRDGSGGHGVHRVRHDDGTFRIGEHEVKDLASLPLQEGSLVFEFAEQHPYAARIFPGSTNSMRLMTLWDYDRDEPFFAPFAAHRFGTTRSQPVDNFERGGVHTSVDLETGELGTLMVAVRDGKVIWKDEHPDTGVVVRGQVVPHWERIRTGILDIARRLQGIRYVGWDVVVTRDGFTIIEGNNRPAAPQVFRPMLSEPRALAFYRRHRVVRRPVRHDGA